MIKALEIMAFTIDFLVAFVFASLFIYIFKKTIHQTKEKVKVKKAFDRFDKTLDQLRKRDE